MIYGKNGKKYYKVALHLHSTLSDGKLTPEEIAAEKKAMKSKSFPLTAPTLPKSDCLTIGYSVTWIQAIRKKKAAKKPLPPLPFPAPASIRRDWQ